MAEIWKPIPNYEGVYSVSNMGRVRSEDRITADGRRVRGKVLNPITRADGYQQVSRYLGNGKMGYELIHRLVAVAFLGCIPDGYVVDHIDRNRANNKACNLRLLPKAENDSQGGKAQGKRVAQYTKDGRQVCTHPSVAEAGRRTGIEAGDISRVCNGKRKTAGGFCWGYI